MTYLPNLQMKTEKKTWRGTILALGILALGFTLALSTRVYYSARHPSALEARFVDKATISARFSPKDIPTVLPGLPARISVGKIGYYGTVVGQENGNEFTIVLTGTNAEPPPANTPCRVTVDASIPPEFLKKSEFPE